MCQGKTMILIYDSGSEEFRFETCFAQRNEVKQGVVIYRLMKKAKCQEEDRLFAYHGPEITLHLHPG